MSPLLAEVIAYCDSNNNLDLMRDTTRGIWKHPLWLTILANDQLSSLKYDGFLSPTHHMLREKATVKMFGSGDRIIEARIPFSWLLKDHLSALYKHAKELQGKFGISWYIRRKAKF